MAVTDDFDALAQEPRWRSSCSGSRSRSCWTRTSVIEVSGPIRMSGWLEIGTLSVPVKLVRT
jgi:hypothetical protein